MPVIEFTFFILLFIVAFLYASVGHGGASGYLALMALFSFAPETMRSSALFLNILVSFIAFFQFYQAGHFQWNLFWPFAITSVPAAFIGGLWTIETDLYKKILAILLLFSALRFFMKHKQSEAALRKQNLFASLIIGAAIGLFSGMIGIGGGIILSPIILILNWANMKQTAAVSALFIFINSIAGLGGLWMNGFSQTKTIYPLILIALVGGLLGSFFGAKKIKSHSLQYILALVLIIASMKLILS